jgi:tetratricopeptide (TPR) repeat protein
MRRAWWWTLLLWATAVWAQPAVDPDVTAAKSAYDFGRNEEALQRAKERIDRGELSEDALIELHKYAGLAAFNLGQREEAERHFTALLRLNPDHHLDPFTVAPGTVAFYEQLRKKHGPMLDVVRERRGEKQRLERQRAEEEQRRRIEELTRKAATVRTVERRSVLVNFVPFGAGQFQQGRNTAGLAFAVSEGAFAATSIVAYFAYASLLRKQTLSVETGPGQRVDVVVTGIPASQKRDRDNWNLVKMISGIGFYVLYAGGVTDALLHHQDETVTTRQENAAAVQPYVTPISGGAAAGVGWTF